LAFSPDPPLYPPKLPLLAMTRWQGMTIGTGLLANA